MATIKMLANISGTRDGVEWPALGGTIDLPTDEADALVAAGLGRIIDAPKVERATPRAKTETATRKGVTRG